MWIEVDERFAFGEGGLDLLQGIERTGSLTQAACRIGWSYRHAWGYLRQAEHTLGMSLVHNTPGKGMRRGMQLTEDGRALITAVTQLRAQAATACGPQFNTTRPHTFHG